MQIDQFFERFAGESLTYEDLILLPHYVDFGLEEIALSTSLTREIQLRLPVISSPMDTVTESELAIALARAGGIGMIHYNAPPDVQRAHLARVKAETDDNGHGLLVGAAVETWNDAARERVACIADVTDVLVFDTAQGYSRFQIDLVRWIKSAYPHLQVIAGNVVTGAGCAALIAAGADAIRVGMGSGSICTTQEVSGAGRGQATAVYECARIGLDAGVPIIADGGCRSSADIAKALSLGASCVMLGSLLAGVEEAAGSSEVRDGQTFKRYRGMGSLQAMEAGSAARYGAQAALLRMPEGVLAHVRGRGPLDTWLGSLMQGVRQGLHKLGHPSIERLTQRVRRNQIEIERRSQSAMREGRPHSVELPEGVLACID